METGDFLAKPVDDNFPCTIFQNVMVKPCTCSQGHQFCLECITTWLQQSPTCPSRCGDLAVGNLAKFRGIENLFEKLQVHCCHAGLTDGQNPGQKNLHRRSRASMESDGGGCKANGGCGWVGAVEDRAKHLRDECAFSEVVCSCQGCDAKIPRFQLAEHETGCAHREVSCEKCQKTVKAGETSDHLLGCKMVVKCPQECGAVVLRGNLEQHEKGCENVVVGCSFAEHGCSVRRKRKKIGEHEEEAAVAHARLAARQAGREHERSAALEKELSEQTKEFHAEKKKLEAELEASKRRVVTLDQQLTTAMVAAAAGQDYGQVRVSWTIEDFTAKAMAKETIGSKQFHVHTKAGKYEMSPTAAFYKGGSVKRGYLGFRLNHGASDYWDSEDDASDSEMPAKFPVSLRGTKLTVEKGAKNASKTAGANTELRRHEFWRIPHFLSTDKIHGLDWTDAYASGLWRVASAGQEPEYDVTECLENDTLAVSCHIRATPPAEDVSI